jgi:hypothetical protein
MQRLSLQLVSDYYDGSLDFVDATNPMISLMEAAAVMTTGFMTKNEVNTRRQYPSVSQTQEDLYHHMSDKDYIGRFALPSTAKITLLLEKAELLSRLVDDPSTKSQKMVIPRNTFFTVAGTTFSLQYPIVISVEQHGGMNIVYDTDKTSPLQALETNVVEWEPVSDGTYEYVKMTFDVQQFFISSKSDKITSSKTYQIDIATTDAYYYTRVYAQINGVWTELQTTHSDQVYDPTVPTAVLTVSEGNVNVKIPQVYTTNQLVGKSIRIDVYQTKGALEMLLLDYGGDMFSVTWKNYDPTDDTVYTAAIKNFRHMVMFAGANATGGRAALTFDQLRSRVMQNATGATRTLPISNVQLETALEDSGYSIVLDVDNITQRTLLATKPMPVPSNEKLITAANAAIETISFSFEQLRQLDTVINNGASMTITPNTIYQQVDGVTSPISTAEVNEILALAPERRALAVSTNAYRFSPWYYILDTSGKEFDVRAYQLDNPAILSKTFVEENATTLFQVATQGYGIFRTATGYQIQIVTKSSASFQALDDDDVHVQLSFVPVGEKDRAFLNGVLYRRTDDGERIYTFDLSSNMNVDANNSLFLTQFLMYTTEARLTGTPLTANFDLVYSVSTYMDTQWQENGVDQVLGRLLLPPQIAGVTQERLQVKFGSSLDTLWKRGRSFVTGAPFKTYQTDVPMYYENDVYELGADGSPVQFINGQLVMNKLHNKGDPVLEADGVTPVLQYKKGDPILDPATGEPVPDGLRGMMRQVDVFLLEGSYWFATDISAAAYLKELVEKVVDWLTNDLATISQQLLEETRIYFYPKTTMGMIDVLTSDDLIRSIRADHTIDVVLEVTEDVYKNDELKKKLTDSTIPIVSDHLSRMTISMSAMSKDLGDVYGNDVVNHYESGLGGALNLTSLTVVDNATRCSLRKRLTAQQDDTLFTEEDVVISFVQVSASK